MLVHGKPEKPGVRTEQLRGPDFIETAGHEREAMRVLGREFEQTLMAVQMASMDELTLLTNHHGFKVLAQLWLEACQELEKPASLLFFDLESVEHGAERHGRREGDNALKTFADVLRIGFRESDVVGRIGDDEFAVLLTGSTAVQVARIRARLKEILDERNSTLHQHCDIRFSINQVEFEPARHKTVEGLMAAIDQVRHAGSVRF